MSHESFNQPTWNDDVKNALQRIDWRKVIASVRFSLTEGPPTDPAKAIHDELIPYKGRRVEVSRSFCWSLLSLSKDWSFSLKKADPDELVEAIRQATDIVDVLWRALIIHFDKVPKCKGKENSLEQTIIKYACLCLDNNWAKYLKFHTCAFYSIYEKDSDGNSQELPPLFGSDRPGTLFVGELDKISRQKASSNQEPLQAAAYRFTILQGVKKGMPLLDDDDIYNNIKSGAKDLSAVKVVPTNLLSEVKRTVQEVFGKDLGSIRDYLCADPFETMSTHACIDGPRKIGGALGFCYSKVVGSKRWLHFWDDNLARVRFHPWLGTWEDRTPAWTLHERDWLSRRREKVMKHITAENFPPIVEGLGEFSEENWSEERQRAVLESIGANRSDLRKILFRGILEPLKVRPISVSRFEVNHLWQPIQKKMWKLLQRFPCFKLTGTPVTSEIITELCQSAKTACDGCFPSMFRIVRAVSADFRAATNVLALSASLAAVESSTVCKDLKAVMRNGLVGSWMHCMNGDQEEELGVQTNGQLMGCVFSFPILCLINAAITRSALERDLGRRLSLRECPMLINGDDMLCFLTPSGYADWKRDTCAVGLEPSVGKNYYSDRFLMVNSRIFDMSPNDDYRKEVEIKITPRPFVNFSFITGIQKTGCSTTGEKEELSEDHCMKALSSFSQSLEFHKGLPLKTQAAVEQNIWTRRQRLWSGLGLSTGPSGLDLAFHPELQPDNRLDYILAKKSWGPFKKKLEIPCGKYLSGPDYGGTWRLQQSLVRTSDVWSECTFIRRAMLSGQKVCQKYRALVRETNNLTPIERTHFVMLKRLIRSLHGSMLAIVKDWPNRYQELYEDGTSSECGVDLN